MKCLNLVLDQTMINCVQSFERIAAKNAHNSIGKRKSVEYISYTMTLRNQSQTFSVTICLNDVFHCHWAALIRVEDGKILPWSVAASILILLKVTAQIVVSGRVTSNKLDEKLKHN